jgi:hypothetical protein
MSLGIVWRIYVGFVVDIDIKILKVPNVNLNPVPNAHVCVFDGTYYKITIANYIFKTSLYTTCHFAKLLVAVEGPPKLPKHYHSVQ